MDPCSRFRVTKTLNNNVVLARDLGTGETVVLQGRGLGFGARPGTELAASDGRIEAVFRPAPVPGGAHEAGGPEPATDEGQRRSGDPASIPPAVVPAPLPALVRELIDRAQERFREPLDPHIQPALLDHLTFAIHRVRRGLPLTNPLLAEIRTLFPEEFDLALEGVRRIGEAVGVELAEDEAGFVALHLQAARHRVPVRQSVRHTTLIHDLIERVRRTLGVPLPPGDLDYARLAAHLRYLVDTVSRGEVTPNPLLHRIEAEFPEAMALARELGAEIARRLGRPVGDSDLGYVALHLAKLRLRE
ncbi:MAG TPA: PRD domain-containing protein [Thermaerobacter sp.]